MDAQIISKLPGTDGSPRDAYIFETVLEAIKLLDEGKQTLISANDGGAINVWIDDAGVYNCNREYHKEVEVRNLFIDVTRVGLWLEKHLPIIQKK